MLCFTRFAQGLRLRQVDLISDDIAGSSKTLTSMSKRLRKVCIAAIERMRRRGRQRLGGRREFVAIDESHFRHKRKVNANSKHRVNFPSHHDMIWVIIRFQCAFGKRKMLIVSVFFFFFSNK